jgi:hypothetical protein
VRDVDQFLDKQVTDTTVMKFVKTDQKKYLDEFLELIGFISKNIKGAVINRINRNILNGLPTTHPFVISEKRKKEEELEKQRQQEIERKEREEARKIKEKAGRNLFFYVLGFFVFVILIVGLVWGWGWAAFITIIGVYIVGVLDK